MPVSCSNNKGRTAHAVWPSLLIVHGWRAGFFSTAQRNDPLPTKLGNLAPQFVNLYRDLWRRADAVDRLLLFQDFEPLFFPGDDRVHILRLRYSRSFRRLAWDGRRIHGFQGIQQFLKLALEYIVVFPACEVGDEVVADFLCEVLPCLRVEALS